MKALIFLPFLLQITLGKPLNIPAFTAYLDPDPNGARVSKDDGITDWNTATNKIKWSGQLKIPEISQSKFGLLSKRMNR